MWSKKWHLKRNISCDAHLLNELLETAVPWDDAIVVSADKLRKLWDSLSELRSSLCERRLERTSSEGCAISCQSCAVYSDFPSGMIHTVKSLSLTLECVEPFRCSWDRLWQDFLRKTTVVVGWMEIRLRRSKQYFVGSTNNVSLWITKRKKTSHQSKHNLRFLSCSGVPRRFFRRGEGFNKPSWRQRSDRTGIWGR
jgi:hypothetical protein